MNKKCPEEIAQMNEIAAALTALMRVALKDETATVEYDFNPFRQVNAARLLPLEVSERKKTKNRRKKHV